MKITSMVGLVTNSSTTIYSYAQLEPMRKFLDVLGLTDVEVRVTYNKDSIFDILYDSIYDISEWSESGLAVLVRHGFAKYTDDGCEIVELSWDEFYDRTTNEFITDVVPYIEYMDEDTPTNFIFIVDGKEVPELTGLANQLFISKEIYN